MAQLILDKFHQQKEEEELVCADSFIPFIPPVIAAYNPDDLISFDEKTHTYTLNSTNELIPSATTILKIISKPGLMYWALNQAEEHVLSCFRKKGGIFTEQELITTLSASKKAHEKTRDLTAGIGTKAHEWAEMYIKGTPLPMPEDPLVLNCVTAFLNWVNSKNIRFINSEKRVYSQKYKYAGTVDFVAEIDGKLYVGDFKTSKSIYPSMFYQTAAYQQALTEEMPWLEFKGNIIVRMGKDGAFEEKELLGMNEFMKNFISFMSAKTLFDRENELNKIFEGAYNGN